MVERAKKADGEKASIISTVRFLAEIPPAHTDLTRDDNPDM